jgi:hypothetical protein
MTISNEQLMDKLLAQSPDELLLHISMLRATRPDAKQLLNVFKLAYEAVCQARLDVALGVGGEAHD